MMTYEHPQAVQIRYLHYKLESAGDGDFEVREGGQGANTLPRLVHSSHIPFIHAYYM